MHRFSKVFAAIFFFLVFGAGLILINRDIFLFENDFNIQKTFTPQNDTKGIYQLTRALPLVYSGAFNNHGPHWIEGFFSIVPMEKLPASFGFTHSVWSRNNMT